MWSGDCILKDAFPEFYCISRTRDSSAVKVMCPSDGRIHWDVQFCHIVHDREIESLALFMDIVHSLFVQGLGLLEATMSRGFEFQGFYLSLYPPTIISFPGKMV